MSQVNALDMLKAGIATAKAGDKARARFLLRRATQLDPNNELAWLWLAGVTESLHDVVFCMQRVLEIDPTHERALAGLKWARAQMAQRSQAWECPLCQVSSPEQVDKCSSCGAILTLSDVDALLGNQEADSERLRQAIERHKRPPASKVGFDAHFALALAYLNLKELDAGISQLRAAMHLRPNDQTLRAQVATLLQRKAAAEARAREKAKEEPASRGTVLVVDDSPTVCTLVTITLERQGYQVTAASDGLDALAKINDGLPDLILLDIMMPRLDGYQVCKIIKGNEETKHIPVIMLSGKDGFFDKVRGRMAGSTEYITKPFEPASLLLAMEKHICG